MDAKKISQSGPLKQGAGFFAGLQAAFDGIRLLTGNRSLMKLAAIPIAINTVLYIILVVLFGVYFDDLRNSVWQYPELSAWYDYLLVVLWYLFNLLFFIVSLLVFLVGFLITGNILAAPFNDEIAGRTLVLLRGEDLPQTGGGLGAVLAETGRTVVQELKKIALYLLLQIPTLLLLLIPVAGGVLSTAWGLYITWWFFSLDYLDYPMTRLGMVWKEKRAWVSRNRAMSLGFGAAVNLMLFVPFLNLLALPACAVAATVLFHRVESSVADGGETSDAPTTT